jgi:hypothetical protein
VARANALARRAAALSVCGLALAGRAARADDEPTGVVIFARGSSLFQVDARGRAETEIAQLAAPAAPAAPAGGARAKPSAPSGPSVAVRALRSDAGGSVLLADLAGKWAWMPLDGSTRSLTELPCADGPAQLAEDGSSVLCRAPQSAARSLLVDLPRGAAATRPARTMLLDVPPGGARIIGSGAERALVWADATGVWTSPAGDPRRKTRVAPQPPLRGFLASPDGERAIGTYADQVFTDLHHTRPAEVLMTMSLDDQGARRKAIRDGVAVEWSHDSQWVLVQDGGSACIMRASGGQYKCWRGYTAASLSSDGRWALALGNRDGSKKQSPPRPAARPVGKPAAPVAPPASDAADRRDDKPWDRLDEPSDEPEAGDAPPANDDVSVAPPSGPQSLYRLRLEGAFTDRPTVIVKVVDGAAVWVPREP